MNRKRKHLDFHASSLRTDFPEGQCNISDNDVLIWEGELQASPLSRIYKIKIRYEAYEKPIVTIRSYGLKIPYLKHDIHMYNNGDLCLFYKEWNPEMAMSKFIVPWICEWLYFYEHWCVTGQWLGGGAH